MFQRLGLSTNSDPRSVAIAIAGRSVRVVQQDLFGKQWQKGGTMRCSGHAEHIAEVGAGGHVNVFERICKVFLPS